jgi:hypothetical protein
VKGAQMAKKKSNSEKKNLSGKCRSLKISKVSKSNDDISVTINSGSTQNIIRIKVLPSPVRLRRQLG